MARAHKSAPAHVAVDVLWVLSSPEPHPSRAVCSLRSTRDGFETAVQGLGTTLRWAYSSRDAAVAASTRLCDQLQQRGWVPCDGTDHPGETSL